MARRLRRAAGPDDVGTSAANLGREMSTADEMGKQAADRVREVVAEAERRAEEIVAQAESDADGIRQRAEADAEERIERAQSALRELAGETPARRRLKPR